MAQKTVYPYCTNLKVFYQECVLEWDEKKGETCCPLAPNWIEVKPPAYGVGEIPMWKEDHWEIVPDLRWVQLYDKKTGDSIDPGHVLPGFDADHYGATPIPRPDETYVWSGGKWVQDAGRAKAKAIKEWEFERDAYIKSIQRPIQLHQDEQIVSANVTSISPEVYKALIEFRIKVNRLSPLEPFPPLPQI